MTSRFIRPAAILLLAGAAAAQGPLTPAFTYQGQLSNGGTPVPGAYDLRFRLYDGLVAGSQLGSASTQPR